MSRLLPALFGALCVTTLSQCTYLKLFRPATLAQLNPRMVRVVDELQNVNEPNDLIVSRLFVTGGLEHASVDTAGLMHATIRVPEGQLVWQPAIIVMPHGGELELEFQNDDENYHMAFLPNDAGRVVLKLPIHRGGRARIRLDQPGLYWFGCPVSNHAGRGMLGFVLVGGESAPDARLDRPRQPRP